MKMLTIRLSDVGLTYHVVTLFKYAELSQMHEMHLFSQKGFAKLCACVLNPA